MKLHRKSTQSLTLGDLILAVCSSTKKGSEAAAAVYDLFGSGQVRFLDGGRQLRVRVV
jgi:hypothetical protein